MKAACLGSAGCTAHRTLLRHLLVVGGDSAITAWHVQERLKALRKEHGSKELGKVTTDMVIGGMRGITVSRCHMRMQTASVPWARAHDLCKPADGQNWRRDLSRQAASGLLLQFRTSSALNCAYWQAAAGPPAAHLT